MSEKRFNPVQQEAKATPAPARREPKLGDKIRFKNSPDSLERVYLRTISGDIPDAQYDLWEYVILGRTLESKSHIAQVHASGFEIIPNEATEATS